MLNLTQIFVIFELDFGIGVSVKSGELQKKKVFAEIQRLFLAEITNLNVFSGQKQVISKKKKKKEKKGLRRNPKAFSGRNHQFNRFLRPKTGDLKKKKTGFCRNPKTFSGQNHNLNVFSGQKQQLFPPKNNTMVGKK